MNCSRDFGNRNNVDQAYLYVGGLLFNVLNGVSRLIWGFLLDKFKFKKIMIVITIIEIIVGSTIYFMVKYQIIYIIELLFVALCIGGSFSIIVPAFVDIFGLFIGPELYGLAVIFISIANLLGPILITFIGKINYSYLIVFSFGAGLCIIKLIVLFFFDENQKMFDDADNIKKKIDIEMTNDSPITERENEA